MSNGVKRIALLASYEKDAKLIELARLLQKNGWSLLGSAGTAKYLNENGISCKDVAEMVGPPILGHRVVTLARPIHAGLLARPEDHKELLKLGIPILDLVYVTLYPLESALADPAVSENEVIEKTDIGGPTLLRSAAKGRRIVISSFEQVEEARPLIEGTLEGEKRDMLITKLAAAAERRVAEYVDASARYWESRAARKTS